MGRLSEQQSRRAGEGFLGVVFQFTGDETVERLESGTRRAVGVVQWGGDEDERGEAGVDYRKIYVR